MLCAHHNEVHAAIIVTVPKKYLIVSKIVHGIQWLTTVNIRVLCETLEAHWPNAGCPFLPYIACEQILHWEESREVKREP